VLSWHIPRKDVVVVGGVFQGPQGKRRRGGERESGGGEMDVTMECGLEAAASRICSNSHHQCGRKKKCGRRRRNFVEFVCGVCGLWRQRRYGHMWEACLVSDHEHIIKKITRIIQPDQRVRFDLYVKADVYDDVLKTLIEARNAMEWYVRSHRPGHHD